MEFTWNLHGIYMEFTWNLHGIYMEFTWNLHEIYMEFTWNLHGIYMEFNLWNMVVQYTIYMINNICNIHNNFFLNKNYYC